MYGNSTKAQRPRLLPGQHTYAIQLLDSAKNWNNMYGMLF
jgi:hypothetical protein